MILKNKNLNLHNQTWTPSLGVALLLLGFISTAAYGREGADGSRTPTPLSQMVSGCKNFSNHFQSSTLTYALTHNQVPGRLAESIHTFTVSADKYTLNSVSESRGMLALLFSGQLVQKSEGDIDPKQGLLPNYYSEKRGKKPLAETRVSPESGIQFKKNGTSAPYEFGLMDRLVLPHQIAALLRCKVKFADHSVHEVRMITTGRVGSDRLKFYGIERIQLVEEGPEVQVLRFEILPEDREDDTVRMWFAKDSNFTPVRIQVEDNKGKAITQTLIK